MSTIDLRAYELCVPACAADAVNVERLTLERQANETGAFEAICDMAEPLSMLMGLQQRFNWRLMRAGTLWNGIEDRAAKTAADLRKLADAIEADVAAVKAPALAQAAE